MKLKHRLSLYSIFIFSIITLFISIAIYFSYYVQMEKLERNALSSKSLLAAIYYLEQDELSSLEHENIKRQLQKTISRKNIIVVDSLNHRKAGDMLSLKDISNDFFAEVRLDKQSFFSTQEYFYNGIFYSDNEGDFVIVTRESKNDFNNQMESLLHILVISFLVGMLIIYFFSRFLGYIAYKPIIDFIAQIKIRNSENFETPIKLKKSYSEIQDLVHTYNLFVDRIAQTFNVQKNFIDYVSHELRSPITALLGTLEVTKQRERSIGDYKVVISELQQYTRDLEETLEQMMLLSGAKTTFEFTNLRIDEIVWQSIENAVLYHKANVEVNIEVENTDLLGFQGNDKLLVLAFNNIIENAIKYSNNKPVKVIFEESFERLQVIIKDQGIGISETDLKNVMQNFFRGANTQNYPGKGIGLSMANIIFSLHNIELIIQNHENGTWVILKF